MATNLIELCTNQSIAAILPSTKHYTPYLYHNLDWRYDELRELSTGDGGRGGLNLSIIRSIIVPIPSLEEQRAIADCLDDLDSEILELVNRVNKTRAVKLGMMQQLLSGKRRFVQ